MSRLIVVGDSVVGIYGDTLAPMFHALGPTDIQRASHVEPCEGGMWCADLSPVNGPVLGPYTQRQEALDAEVEWLQRNLVAVALGRAV